MTQANDTGILIYTHPDCSFSAAAKMEYRKNKTAYTEIDLAPFPLLFPWQPPGGFRCGFASKISLVESAL